MLEADFRQAAVAGPAHPGDAEGLVDRAFDARPKRVLALPVIGLPLGAGPGEGFVGAPSAAG